MVLCNLGILSLHLLSLLYKIKLTILILTHFNNNNNCYYCCFLHFFFSSPSPPFYSFCLSVHRDASRHWFENWSVWFYWFCLAISTWFGFICCLSCQNRPCVSRLMPTEQMFPMALSEELSKWLLKKERERKRRRLCDWGEQSDSHEVLSKPSPRGVRLGFGE